MSGAQRKTDVGHFHPMVRGTSQLQVEAQTLRDELKAKDVTKLAEEVLDCFRVVEANDLSIRTYLRC